MSYYKTQCLTGATPQYFATMNTKQFTAIELIDATGNVVADVYGYKTDKGAINDVARVNICGFMQLSGFNTMWFIPTRWSMPQNVISIQAELSRLKSLYPTATTRITSDGAQFLNELHLSF